MTVQDHSGDVALIPDLSPQAEVAILGRVLYREGWDDHISGHITYRQPDGTILVNPHALAWDELRPADIQRIDIDGNLVEGNRRINSSVVFHRETMRARPDVMVAVHGHPRWTTIWCDLHRSPPIYDQTSAQFDGDLLVIDEYGDPTNLANAQSVGEALRPDHKGALLANHGPFVVAASIRQAYLRCTTLEWRSRQAWHVEAVGGGVLMNPTGAQRFGEKLDQLGYDNLWEAMVRRELRLDPTFFG